MVNNAKLPDHQTFIDAGIDPKTRLPIKAEEECTTKKDIRRLLNIVDEQDAVNSFRWYNLPSGIDSHLIERILYYRGQGMFFYIAELDKYYFLPYTLNGPIDVYGRFKSVSPIPFNGVADGKEEKAEKSLADMTKDAPLSGIVRSCAYEVMLEDGNAYRTHCVLLHDYTNQISQTNIARSILQSPVLDVMSDMIPFMDTALLLGTGITGMRVNDQDQQATVTSAAKSIRKAALTGKPWIGIVAQLELQTLTNGQISRAEEYMLAMQSLNNFRLTMHGLDNGGLFEKKAHLLGSEQAMSASNAGRILQDRLDNRQRFCDIVNSIWGLGIYCEPAENATGADSNFDGRIIDEQDQTGTMPGEQPQGVVADEEL